MAAVNASATRDDAPASELLKDLATAISHDDVAVGDLIDRLDARGHGLLLLILALPMCIPNVPGISTVFGLLLIPPALQMMAGRSSVWMPTRVRRWRFKGESLRTALRSSAKLLAHVEHLSKPRASALTQWPATAGAGLQTLVMAIVLILPIWGANLIPGIAVSLTGLALLQRDGWAMIASIPVAAAALAWVYFGAKYTISFFVWLTEIGRTLIGAIP